MSLIDTFFLLGLILLAVLTVGIYRHVCMSDPVSPICLPGSSGEHRPVSWRAHRPSRARIGELGCP
jgi:hypothetical protein